MLLKNILNEQEVSALAVYDLSDILTVPIEQVWSWVRTNVHTTLCAYLHERSIESPWKFFLTCTNKRLNRACGHTYSLWTLINVLQQVISRVLERDRKDVKNECGDPEQCHARSARSDEVWAQRLSTLRVPSSMFQTASFVRTPDAHLLMRARMQQQIDAQKWESTVRATLCWFEEAVSVLKMDHILGLRK